MENSTDLRQAADIDLNQFTTVPDTHRGVLVSPDQLEPGDAEVMAGVGVHVENEDRSGTYILQDFNPLCVPVQTKGLELLPIAVALKKYDWLRKKYCFKAVNADLDKYTLQCASAADPQGYFVHVKKGVKVPFPVQACLYIAQSGIAQTIHNIVILEEDSELQLITGCASRTGVGSAAHLGISEHFIGPKARFTNTMIHSWNPDVEVRSRSGTIVDAGGTFISNYISLRPSKSIQTNPRTWLNGEGASLKYLTIILGFGGSTIDTGGDVYLNGKNSSAELAHRAVCTGGRIYQRGLLTGNTPGCRAHIDCAGMVLDAGEDGFIEAVPGLKALHPDARMSHEASIGRIAPEQVAYLQSRGMSEREAISLLIRGFLDLDIEGLSPELDARIAEIADLAGHGEGI